MPVRSRNGKRLLFYNYAGQADANAVEALGKQAGARELYGPAIPFHGPASGLHGLAFPWHLSVAEWLLPALAAELTAPGTKS